MNTTQEKEYIISVTGYSRIFVKPNYFTIDITLECISNSMESSLQMINEDMANMFRLAESVGILKDIIKDIIKVVDLDFGLDYIWKNNTHVFNGYKVNQKVCIEMDVTVENEAMTKAFVSRLSGMLTNMEKCDINYALKNKKEHLAKVRELSFLDAQEKAQQYAKLAGVKIVGTNTISDIERIEEYSRSNAMYEASPCESMDDANLPNGKKVVLENTVYVVFDIGKK